MQIKFQKFINITYIVNLFIYYFTLLFVSETSSQADKRAQLTLVPITYTYIINIGPSPNIVKTFAKFC